MGNAVRDYREGLKPSNWASRNQERVVSGDHTVDTTDRGEEIIRKKSNDVKRDKYQLMLL
jgi:hypothetical protein